MDGSEGTDLSSGPEVLVESRQSDCIGTDEEPEKNLGEIVANDEVCLFLSSFFSFAFVDDVCNQFSFFLRKCDN